MNLPNIHPIINQIAETVSQMIDRGFTVDTGLAHFIDSTFACPNGAELAAILTDDNNCETDSLIDLVLSPDLGQSLEMEAVLENIAAVPSLETANENNLLALLPDSFETALRFPDQGPISFCVSKSAVACFVKRFHLFYKISPEIRNSLAQRFSETNDRLAAMVMMRQFQVDLTDERRQLLRHYIDNSIFLNSDEFPDCLAQLLTLFLRPVNTPDFFDELTAEKEDCLRQIEQTEQMEKQLAAKNMETLMLQGQRGFLSVDRDAVQQKIDRLDTLGRILFGRTPAPGQGPASSPAQTFSFEKEPGR